VASLRDLLADPSAVAPVSQRRVDATVAAAVAGVDSTGDLLPWYLGALGELYAELAVIAHAGSRTDRDRAYGALGTYVASHALQVDGPIREYYLVGRRDTPDENSWRTEIGWPIFSTGAIRLRQFHFCVSWPPVIVRMYAADTGPRSSTGAT